METGDSLFEVDLLLIVIVLPVAGCIVAWLFIRHTPNRHMKTMPATAARLIMSGNFIFSKNGVTTEGGISVSRVLLMNVVEFFLPQNVPQLLPFDVATHAFPQVC